MPFNMLPSRTSHYTRVSCEGDVEVGQKSNTHSSFTQVFRALTATLLTASVICVWTVLMLHEQQDPVPAIQTCHTVAIRKEWRILTAPQQREYLESVQCLKKKPSRLGLNHTLYDDFPFVHSRIGKYVHDAAPFLAWHRYFVHVYEKALKEQCGYSGTLPFWDWQLDWQDITQAPVWNSNQGFGTNGDSDSSSHAILRGYCVVDGPFANFEIPYLDEKYYPHCLSRGFAPDEVIKNNSEKLSPDSINGLMSMDKYSSFNLGLEHGPHLAIPRTVRGDFSLLTAPSDPVFFLHHAQLDRLWWEWQLLHPERRMDYGGDAAHRSQQRATTGNMLLVGGLGADVAVSQILDTQGGLLCYRY